MSKEFIYIQNLSEDKPVDLSSSALVSSLSFEIKLKYNSKRV